MNPHIITTPAMVNIAAIDFNIKSDIVVVFEFYFCVSAQRYELFFYIRKINTYSSG